MKYAIISDLHSNRQALKAVLTDIRSNKIDDIICLGDIVGYGPAPAAVMETAYQKINHFILGNHDAAVCGLMNTDNFNDDAQKSIEWTKKSLDKNASKFFNQLPLVLTGDNFRCAHGEFTTPGEFRYIFEPEDALESFRSCSDKLLFIGHSHVPGIYVIGQSGTPHWLKPMDFKVESEKRYIINVGSVGQPRDNDIRSSYCIYDSNRMDITFRKVPFDIDAYKEDLRKNSLDSSTSYFLQIEGQKEIPSLRDIVDFRPAKNSMIQESNEKSLEEEHVKLKKTSNILKVICILFLLIFVAIGALFSTGNLDSLLNKATTTIIAPTSKGIMLTSSQLSGNEIILMPEDKGSVSSSTPLENWGFEISEPEKQNINIDVIDDIPIFRIVSQSVKPIVIYYMDVPVTKNIRFNASSQFNPAKFEDGVVELFLEQELVDGTKKVLGKAEPKSLSPDKGWTCRASLTLGKDEKVESGTIRYKIRLQFKGELLIRKCSLKIKD